MPIDPINWNILGQFLMNAVVKYFLDKLESWADRVVRSILDSLNEAIEVSSEAVVKLVKEGYSYYKRAEAYVMNIRTGKTRIESRQEEIEESEIPQEILEELRDKAELKLLQSSS